MKYLKLSNAVIKLSNALQMSYELIFSSGNMCLSVELHTKHEQVNMSGDAQLLSLVWSLQVQQQNSKSKQERTNTSLLSVNINTNTKADKHRVEQTGDDNKQVGQIMQGVGSKRNKGQGTNKGEPHQPENGVQFLFCTTTNANNVSHTNFRHINAGKLRK